MKSSHMPGHCKEECSWVWVLTGQGSWQQLSCKHDHEKMFLFMLPQVWLTSREKAWKSWLHWPKPALFMTKEPCYQITKNLKGDFEILALSWPDEPGQEDWFTEEYSLVTLLEICQQWVNLFENFSPYSSWSKRMVLLPLCFWGKNAAKTELPKAILKKSWLRQ